MRLLAAARLSASGSCMNARTAASRSAMSSIRCGAGATTDSTSLAL